jgi:glycosyltransferase involved in cell wall biosynthesis
MLSICIPTLNRAKLLKKNLDILLTFKKLDIEVNISNNGSNDSTLEVIEEYQHKFGKFNYVSFEDTVDAVTNWDSVVRLATQKYVFALADDDNSLEDGLMAAVEMLEQDQNIIAVYGGCKEYNLNEQFLKDTAKCNVTEIYSQSNRLDLINTHWSLEVPVFRNSFYQASALTHENSNMLGWAFVDAVLGQGNIAVVPQFFFKHYIHSDRTTETMASDGHFQNVCFSDVEVFLAKTVAELQTKMQVLINYKVRFYNFTVAVCIRNKRYIQARYSILRGMLYHLEHFSMVADIWDKSHLINATVEEITNRIEVKSYINSVVLVSAIPEELKFLTKMFDQICVDEIIPAENLDQVADYDKNTSFFIYFGEDQLGKHKRRHNVASFQQVINALKFTKGEITLNLH